MLASVALPLLIGATDSMAIDGGALRITPRNGWKAFEVISEGDDPSADGIDWSLPDDFDGLGAFRPDPTTFRLQLNHETSDATISQVDIDLANFRTAIDNVIRNGSTGGVRFVNSAQQAYRRWSDDAGASWIETTGPSNTVFRDFCSGQYYRPNTFGQGRGFVDNLYITGEEERVGRLFALDIDNRDFYQLSRVTGAASGGLAGMPSDSWENAALIDTGETDHVALLLSPDGGTARMKLFVGEKGKDVNGDASNTFLARNGLAFGSYYFLNDLLPSALGETSLDGTFDTTFAGSLGSAKLEDIDTNPNNPTQVVLGEQNLGLFTFDLDLDFSSGTFDPTESSFSIRKIQNHADNADGKFGDADNVDWTASTVLDGVVHSDGLIFVNEDSSTDTGEIWMNLPDGSELTLIGDTADFESSTESTGILDISSLVGYQPGSILLTNNQGSLSSLSVLINPAATVVPEPGCSTIFVAAALLLFCVHPQKLWVSRDSGCAPR